MTDKDDNRTLIRALDRLGEDDRVAMPASLRARLDAVHAPRRRAIVGRLWGAALIAAALGVAAVPFFVGAPVEAPRAESVAVFDEAFDASWLLGEEITALDADLAELSRSLDESDEGAFTLDLIGDDL